MGGSSMLPGIGEAWAAGTPAAALDAGDRVEKTIIGTGATAVAAFLFAAYSAALWHQDSFNVQLCVGLGLLGWMVRRAAGQQSADAVIAPVSKRRQVSGHERPKRPYIRKAQRIQMRWEKIYNTAIDCGMAGQDAMYRQQVRRLRGRLRQREEYFDRELGRIREYKGTVK